MTRRAWMLAGAAVVVAGVATSVVFATSEATPATPGGQGPSTGTATVVEGELSATVSLAGTLAYGAQPDGSPYLVINRAQGTYTDLPPLGQVISQGQVLYGVDGAPVVLLSGSVPAYRTLAAGATGTDVAQLNADLVALGYATSAQLDPTSAAFGSATTTALEKFQAALGQARTGTLPLGQAVFEPKPVRVTALLVPLGGSAEAGQTVLQATSTTRQVQVALDASQQTSMAVGDEVTVTLPNNQTTTGTVTSVGTVATCPPASGPGGSNSGAPAPGTDTCSTAAPGTTATPVIAVVVTPADPAATGTWDQAPVRVAITTAHVPDALAVPVTALAAQPGGGYALEVVNPGGATHLVAVSLGLFDDADGLVQVSGSGLAAGQRVVVPTL